MRIHLRHEGFPAGCPCVLSGLDHSLRRIALPIQRGAAILVPEE